jgi:hypothetical protein
MDKRQYTSAGFARVGTECKIVFTKNALSHTKRLYNDGAAEVQIVSLPHKMNKVDAVRYLMNHKHFTESTIKIALTAKLARLMDQSKIVATAPN